MEAIGLLCFCSMILAVLVQPACSSSCLASLSPQLRKDCHPDPGASEASCLARDCCWSPWKTPGVPWCFEKVDSCSIVPDSQRVGCHPEAGANEVACVKQGCHWCASENSTAPFCFYNSKEEATCSAIVLIKKLIDCHPQLGASQEICEAKGCVWCSTTIANVPWCFYPADGPHGYTMKDVPRKTAQGWRLTLNKRGDISLFGNDISPIVMDVEFHTKDQLQFKIYDPNNKQFEVPLNIESSLNVPVEPNYDVEFVNDTVLQFTVIRKKTRTVLWETTLGGLIFSDQYIQMMTSVPSTSIYGFGEHEHPSFKHDMNSVRYGMFSRDQSPGAFSNLYGVHPFHMCIEKDFNVHGVLLLNSNAQDVTLSPFPSLTFRTIRGILDSYMFLGPTPENVIQQHTECGTRKFGNTSAACIYSLRYVAVGQCCVPSAEASSPTLPVHSRTQKIQDTDWGAGGDVQYCDIDSMERQLDFTYDDVNFAGLPEYIKELKNDGMHYVIILDPFLKKDEPQGTYKPYEFGQELGIWVNNSDGVTPAIGKAWPPGESVYPD